MCQSVHVLHLRQEDAAKIYCPNAENNFDKQHTGGPLLQILVSLMVDIPASAGSNEIEQCVQEAGRQAMREATQQAVRAAEGQRKTRPHCGSEMSLPNAVWEKASAKRRAIA